MRFIVNVELSDTLKVSDSLTKRHCDNISKPLLQLFVFLIFNGKDKIILHFLKKKS